MGMHNKNVDVIREMRRKMEEERRRFHRDEESVYSALFDIMQKDSTPMFPEQLIARVQAWGHQTGHVCSYLIPQLTVEEVTGNLLMLGEAIFNGEKYINRKNGPRYFYSNGAWREKSSRFWLIEKLHNDGWRVVQDSSGFRSITVEIDGWPVKVKIKKVRYYLVNLNKN